MTAKKTKIGIIGVTGYTGGELLKLALSHPFVEVSYLGSSSQTGHIAAVYPQYAKTNLELENINIDTIAAKCDVVFLATPHGAAMELVPQVLKAKPDMKIIDLGADYRIKDAAKYEEYYKLKHSDTGNLAKAVYGLPEVNRDAIKKASVIANPGCYPTATAIGLAPVLDIIDLNNIVIDGKSGVSGAGKKSDVEYSFCELDENLKPYGIINHRHIPEIEQTLSELAGKDIKVTFTPHLIPMIRGMLVSTYVKLSKSITQADVDRIYTDYYTKEPNIIYTPSISTSAVTGTNLALVYAVVDGDRLKIFCAIDNLVKGAAGQAIQNLNILMGYDEKEGLK